jgi:GNAT superfamily N-acetyltransferase
MLVELASRSVVADCDRILRSLPEWFGIADARIAYAEATSVLPTLIIGEDDAVIAFLSLKQHFPTAWEVHCMAVDAARRNRGLGRQLLAGAESWLAEQGAQLLQVKTLAASHPNVAYARTRAFYEHAGFVSLEVFPELWSADNPCLLMVKPLDANAAGKNQVTEK